MKKAKGKIELIVLGVSAGGMDALKTLFAKLKRNLKIPIIIVQHVSPDQDLEFLMKYYSEISGLKVKEAEEKEEILESVIYFAPPNYHLLIEDDKTLSLSSDEKVNYSRPSIDVLFTSASYVYFNKLLSIILTGANSDGAKGAKIVKENGGRVVAQNPKEAYSPVMPQFVINSVKVDEVLNLIEIAEYINEL